MKIRMITIGRMKSGPHQAIALEYIKRLSHYTPFELVPVKGEDELLKRIGPDDYLVICDERGRGMDSAEFARFIEERQIGSVKYLTFAIGPAEGFSEHVKLKANLNLSLLRFTIQHDLATILLLEQIYRAFMIIRGGPYHK